MKRNIFAVCGLFLMTLVLFAGCSGKGKGGSETNTTSTVVSGKVSLSGTIATGKPERLASQVASKIRRAQNKSAVGFTSEGVFARKLLTEARINQGPALANAMVELFDADHPEWLYPIAVTVADSDGNYTLEVLTNATENNATYVNGDPIPSGNYSIIASKYDVNVGKLFIAVQAAIKRYAGIVAGNDLQAPDSDARPQLITILGLSKNSDGSYGGIVNNQWTTLAINAGVQITFSMPMARLRVIESATVTDSLGNLVDGRWKISADLLTANFAPTVSFTENETYTVKVLGGKSPRAAKNVYGFPIPETVLGKFKALGTDDTPPTAIPLLILGNQPVDLGRVPIITPLRIASNETLDVNSFDINSTPSIGDKPMIRYIGIDQNQLTFKYIYEIVPAVPLQINSNYAIYVSGAQDMAGNKLPSTPLTFKTEKTSVGITATDQATITKQMAVKDVFGKWLNAMNSRNTSLLTTYMTGDFYWLPKNSGGKDDVNRDGRLSLNEFIGMLENTMFSSYERCGTTITGDIVDDPADPDDGISVVGDTANIAFSLTMTSTNKSDPSCAQSPPGTLYSELQNLNGGWLITHGSDGPISSYPNNLRQIELISPSSGTTMSEPTAIEPLLPEFSWLGISGVSSYVVVIIDTNAPMWQTGWIGIVDGTNTEDKVVNAKFNSSTGWHGNVYVASPYNFGFNNMITEIKPGGNYYWAVLGLKGISPYVFNYVNITPMDYLYASSAPNNFSVGGAWKDLVVTVKDSLGNVYNFSEYSGGFNVGSATNVTITVISPLNATGGAVNGSWNISATNSWQGDVLTFNNYGSASFTVNLSSKRNYVYVQDGKGLSKNVNLYTTSGGNPVLQVTQVTAKDCSGNPATLIPDPWDGFFSETACSMTISGTYDLTASISSLYAYVSSNYGYYNPGSTGVSVTGGTFTLADLPVYKGWNRIEIYDQNWVTSTEVYLDTTTGSNYQNYINITSVSQGTLQGSDFYQSVWDVADASQVTITGTIRPDRYCDSYPEVYVYSYVPPQNSPSNPPLYPMDIDPSTGEFSITLDTYNGWNAVYFNIMYPCEGNFANYNMILASQNPVVFTTPHAITNISDPVNTTGVAPAITNGYIQYDAGNSCSVTISGETDNSGDVRLQMNTTTASGRSFYESVTTRPSGVLSPYLYSFTKNIYQGMNTIDLYDNNWNWNGIQVTTTCQNVPVEVRVTSVSDGTTNLSKDNNGYYRTTSSILTIRGAAKEGKLVTARWNDGTTERIATTTALAGDIFSINISPLQTSTYGYISFYDGSTSTEIYYKSDNGTSFKAPVYNVRVGGIAANAGGGLNTDDWGKWTVSTTVTTITGTAQDRRASGVYSHQGKYTNVTGALPINYSTGAFTLSLTLDPGSNFITITDSAGGSFYATINTTGGQAPPPQIVAIWSPDHNATLGSGQITALGMVDLLNFGGTVGTVYAMVYDWGSYKTTYFSSDPNDQLQFGYQPLTYNPATGSFNFKPTIAYASYYAMIEVYAVDSTKAFSHGHRVFVNNTTYNYAESYYKPGIVANDATLKEQEFVRKIMGK